jgi:hypothetical protein
LRDDAKLKGAYHSVLGRARYLETLGFLSGEVSLASKPEELLIAIAHRCRKLINGIIEDEKGFNAMFATMNGLLLAEDLGKGRYKHILR